MADFLEEMAAFLEGHLALLDAVSKIRLFNWNYLEICVEQNRELCHEFSRYNDVTTCNFSAYKMDQKCIC